MLRSLGPGSDKGETGLRLPLRLLNDLLLLSCLVLSCPVLCCVLEILGGPLGRLRDVLVVSWVVLGASWEVLGILGASLGALGAS